MTTLVVGRGLLGSQLLDQLCRRHAPSATVDVPWEYGGPALAAILKAATRVSAAGPWTLAWCAGAGIVASTAQELSAEVALFGGVLAHMTDPPKALFLASSAGGLYAGSPDSPPYAESSVVRPVAPYGVAKLQMEHLARHFAKRGTRVLLGRISNLYGPGQNLQKPQGLISQLCVSQVTRQPLSVFASLDTVRDYIFAADAASMIYEALQRTAGEPEESVVTKIFASGRSVSIGALIGDTKRAFRRNPRLIIRAASGSQVKDLRVRSEVWTDIDQLARTPLITGLRATAEDVTSQMTSGLLAHRMLAPI